MKLLILCVLGLAGGVVAAAGVFASVVILGLVPRLAQKTHTASHLLLYETMMALGLTAGTATMAFSEWLTISTLWEVPIGLAHGVFVGCLAISIAEILDVIPIVGRRLNLKGGLPYVMGAMALGKAMGALVYFLVPGMVPSK